MSDNVEGKMLKYVKEKSISMLCSKTFIKINTFLRGL